MYEVAIKYVYDLLLVQHQYNCTTILKMRVNKGSDSIMKYIVE